VDGASESGLAASHLLEGVLHEILKIYMNLRPSLLDDFGLLAATEWFCRQFREAYPEISLAHEWAAEEQDVPVPLRAVIYRVVQECLNNVAKHSQASSATVSLARRRENLELSVADDGVGFDVPAVLELEGGQRGLGLASMRRRVDASGGTFAVESSPCAGTQIHAVWPVGRED